MYPHNKAFFRIFLIKSSFSRKKFHDRFNFNFFEKFCFSSKVIQEVSCSKYVAEGKQEICKKTDKNENLKNKKEKKKRFLNKDVLDKNTHQLPFWLLKTEKVAEKSSCSKEGKKVFQNFSSVEFGSDSSSSPLFSSSSTSTSFPFSSLNITPEEFNEYAMNITSKKNKSVCTLLKLKKKANYRRKTEKIFVSGENVIRNIQLNVFRDKINKVPLLVANNKEFLIDYLNDLIQFHMTYEIKQTFIQFLKEIQENNLKKRNCLDVYNLAEKEGSFIVSKSKNIQNEKDLNIAENNNTTVTIQNNCAEDIEKSHANILSLEDIKDNLNFKSINKLNFFSQKIYIISNEITEYLSGRNKNIFEMFCLMNKPKQVESLLDEQHNFKFFVFFVQKFCFPSLVLLF